MNYTEIKPLPPLDRYVNCYWILERDSFDSPSVEKIYPDGSVDLVFCARDNEQTAFLIGQQTRRIDIQQRTKSLSIGIRFWPFGAYPIINIPAKEITNVMVDPKEVFGNNFDGLVETIFSKPALQVIQDIEVFLLKRLHASKADIEQVALASRILNSNHGNMRIDTLCEQVNMTRRTLERKFEEATGLTPKSLARIFRFDGVRKTLLKNGVIDFRSLAYEFNYYDQSHFIREFTHYSSSTPSAFQQQVLRNQIHFDKYKFVAFLQ